MGVAAAKNTTLSGWRAALDRRLGSGALRLITPHTRPILLKYAGVSLRSIDFWLKDRVADGTLIPLQRGVYVNALATPRVDLNEVACRLRPGAVVSLGSVLAAPTMPSASGGRPQGSTYAVIPIRRGAPPPSLGVIDTVLGTLHLHGIPERVIGAGALLDRLEPGYAYQRATPERALIDWIYLARTRRSTVTAPPLHELQAASLDRPRLRRLASAAGIEVLLDDYLDASVCAQADTAEIIRALDLEPTTRNADTRHP